jgi:alpha-beta hydrolase superfamily lysophospholipase
MRGHGKSTVLIYYLPNRHVILQDAIDIIHYGQTTCVSSLSLSSSSLPIFFVGSSMGGTIALSVAHEIMLMKNNHSNKNNTSEGTNITTTTTTALECNHDQNDILFNMKITGVILLAPMFQLKIDSTSQYLLSLLSYIILSTMAILPSSNTSNDEKQYRDVKKRIECKEVNVLYQTLDDSTTSSSYLRLGTVITLLEMTKYIQSQYQSITIPFLLCIADKDVFVQNDTSLYDKSNHTIDKTIKHYPALHGLLCETKSLIDIIQQDIIDWIKARI